MKMFRSQERSFKTQIVNVMPTHPLQRIEPADNPQHSKDGVAGLGYDLPTAA
jgi:hypothetical protein